MRLIEWIGRHRRKTPLVILLLFGASLLFRAPTLFNDFYDVDELAAIVQTWEYMAGDVPGTDFAESKLPLYHAIFKLSYSLSAEYGWVIVHAITILIVFLTSLFIFGIGLETRGFRAGLLGGLLYSVLISSFNSQFMATNGEIVFNLPLTAAMYFFILSFNTTGFRKLLFPGLMIIMGAAAAFVKFHGLIFIIFLFFFWVIYYPYFTGAFSRSYLIGILLTGLLFLAAFISDYFITGLFAPRIAGDVSGKLFYSLSKGTDPLVFFAKFIHRQGLFLLWHTIAWVPASAYILWFIKKKFKSSGPGESAAAVFFLITFLLVFAGGSRLYYHYFMVAYPMLCLLSGAALTFLHEEYRPVAALRKHFALFLLLPGLFFLAWNTKDIVIKHYYPAGFYNEGKVLYWTRAVLTGTFNHYLLPEDRYRDAAEYIKNATSPSDRIYVWGDGPYLYYFSGRRLGTHHMWPKTTVIRMTGLYEKGDEKSISAARSIESSTIDQIEKRKPVLFIDTSENGLTGFTYPLPPLLRNYVDENYFYLDTVNKMAIYARKGFVPGKKR